MLSFSFSSTKLSHLFVIYPPSLSVNSIIILHHILAARITRRQTLVWIHWRSGKKRGPFSLLVVVFTQGIFNAEWSAKLVLALLNVVHVVRIAALLAVEAHRRLSNSIHLVAFRVTHVFHVSILLLTFCLFTKGERGWVLWRKAFSWWG